MHPWSIRRTPRLARLVLPLLLLSCGAPTAEEATGHDLATATFLAAPTEPTLYAPIAFAKVETNRPTFEFSAVDPDSGDVTYTLHWDTSPTFSAPNAQTVGPAPSGETASYTLSASQALADGGVYYWRVRGRDGGGINGPWSETRSFTVDTSLGRYGWEVSRSWHLTEGSVSDAVILGDSVTLDWQSSPYWQNDFEDGTTQDFAGTMFSGCGTCVFDASTERALTGNYALRVLDNDVPGYIRYQALGVLSGQVNRVEWWVYRDYPGGQGSGDTYIRLNEDGGPPGGRHIAAVIEFDGGLNNNRQYRYQDGNTAVVFNPARSFSANTWHHVRVEYDAGPKTYDIYIDGVAALLGEPFNEGSLPTNLVGRTLWGADGEPRIYYDRFAAYHPATTGTWRSPPIAYADRPEGTNAWADLEWTATQPGDATVMAQVQYSGDGGDSWALIPDAALPDNSTGFTTSPVNLNAVDPSVYGLIRLRFTLTRTSGTAAPPTLDSVTLSWGVQPLCFGDEFNGSSLEPKWTWLDNGLSGEPASYSVGSPTAGHLRVVAANGTDFFPDCCNNGHLLYQAYQGDFEVTAKLTDVPTAAFNNSGLFAFISPENYLGAYKYFGSGAVRFRTNAKVGGTTSFGTVTDFNNDTYCVRLRRQGDTFTSYRSSDCSSFTQDRELTPFGTVPDWIVIGVSVNEGNSTAVSHTSDVDWVRRSGETVGSTCVDSYPTGPFALDASPATLTADGSSQTTVTSGIIYDGEGNIVPDGTLVTVTLSPDLGATVLGTDRIPGVPGFHREVVDGAVSFIVRAGTVAGDLTITAKATNGDATGSTVVTLQPGAPTDLVMVSGDGQTGTVGTTLADPFVVRVTDANGNGVSGVTVSWSTTGGGGSISPTSTNTDANGLAQATGTLGTVAGTDNNTYAASAGGLTGSPRTFTASALAGSAASLSVTGIVSPTEAGTARSVTVEALDQYGNRATGYTGTVSFSSSDGQATVPADYTFVAGDGGIHTFTGGVVLRTVGTHSVSATDTATSTITGEQTGIQVTPGPAASLVVGGLTSPRTAGTSGSITVEARDAYGNRATGYTGTIAFASNDEQATLPANYTFTGTDAGIRTFSGGVTLRTAGIQSVTATDTVTSSITGSQTGIQVDPAAASTLAVFGIPSPTTAGTAQSVTVEARDPHGNRATGYTGTITFDSDDGQATLPANYTFAPSDEGRRIFSNGVTLRTAGTRSVTATDTTTSTITGTQSDIEVEPAAAASLLVSGIPSPTTAGVARSITVEARDAHGNRATGYTGTINFSSSDDQADLPENHTFTSGDAGIRTFTGEVVLKTAGTQSVTATDTVTSSITGTQAGIEVTPATAASLVVSGIPSPTTAGVARDVTVEARDAYGNRATEYTGTIAFSSSDTEAGLPANYTFTGGDAGLRIFTAGVTLETAGTQSVTAADTTTGSITGTQSGIQVDPAGAATLVVSGIPSPHVAGSAQSVTVEARDAFGNRATGYTGTITFTSDDGQATLPANYTFTSGDAGLRTFTGGVTLRTAGTRLVSAADTGDGGITGTQSGIQVDPAAAASLVVSGIPSPTTAGVARNVTVEAQDAFGNRATGYTGTIIFDSTDSQADLPDEYTFTGGDAGLRTFTGGVVLKTAGIQSVDATDTASSTIAGTQSDIEVTPAAAASLVVSGIPSPITAGSSTSVTVEARDAFGNRATGYTGTVTFASSDTQATLPGNYTFTGGDAGLRTFTGGVTLRTTGTQSVSATDMADGSITGTQAGIEVTSASNIRFDVTGITSPTTAGVARSVTVTVRDEFDNIVSDYTETVTFASSDEQATLPANYTFTGGDGGQRTFTDAVVLRTAGTQSVTASQADDGSVTGSQTGIEVTPAAAESLVVSGISSPRTAGTAGTVTVEARDGFGNRATGYTGTVRFESSDTQATLPDDYTFASGDAGIRSFSGGVTLRTAGTQSVTAIDTGNATITGSQTGIQVNPAAASVLVVTGIPSPHTAGTAQSVTVETRDAYGNRATGYTGTVRFDSSDGQATLPANYTFTSEDAGIRTFTGGVTLRTSGLQSVTATDTGTSTITGTQSGIDVRAAAAVSLVVSDIPSPTVAGTAQSVTVEARDAFGNRATGYTGTIAFSSSDTEATVPSNYTFTSGDAGIRTFATSVTLRTAGIQSVTATDTAEGSIAGAQTGIQVDPAAAATLSVFGIPSPTTAGVARSVTVEALDGFGNRATGYTGTITFTSDDAQDGLPPAYTFASGDAGIRTFTGGVTLNKAGTDRWVAATDDATSSITGSQTGIQVDPAAASTLVVSGIASPTTAGVARSVTVEARDPFGNRATGYTGTINFSSSDDQADLPADYTFVAGDEGRRTFSGGVVLKTAGTRSVTATDLADSGIAGSQTGIQVNPAAASILVVSGITSPTTAGVARSVTVEARDPYGNRATGYIGTVRFTSSDTQADLPTDYTFTSEDAGIRTFSGGVTLKTTGTQSVIATDTATSSITGSQTGIQVNPAAAASLLVSGIPSPVTAGTASSITVEALDPYGNRATGYTGTVRFTSSDGQATLPSDYTFTSTDAGIRTLSNAVRLRTAGLQSVTATDTSTSSITGSQTGIEVEAAAASQLAVSGIPASLTAGTPASVTVEALDPYGNRATTYTGTVRFTSSDGQAELPADYPFTGGDAGIRTFSGGVTLKTAGTQSVTATDTADGTIRGTQEGITVNPAAASELRVSGIASPTTAGLARSVTVEARDPYGNRATGYTGTVTFESSDTEADLPSNYAFVEGDAGIRSFSGGVTLKTAGLQSVTATDLGTPSITGTQADIQVNPGPASILLVSGIPSPISAGTSRSVTVEARDAYGNRATGYTGTIRFTSTDAQADLPENYTFEAADAGLVSLPGVVLKTAGLQDVRATDMDNGAITGAQIDIEVRGGAAASFVVSGIVSPLTAGDVRSVTVEVLDAYGNRATGYTGTIAFSSSDGQATLPANYTFTSGDAGIRTFTDAVTLRTAGIQSVTATDTASSTVNGSQTGIQVEPAAATTLTVSGIPSPIEAGTAATVTVTARDAFGNVATGYLGTLTFSSNDPNASLPGNYTFTSGDAGVRTFTGGVILRRAGTRSVTATDTADGSIAGSQTDILVEPAPADRFVVSGIPSPITAGVSASVTVTARDPYGNTATGYRGTVVFSSDDGQASLPGSYTFVETDAGVRTFSDAVVLRTAGVREVTATDQDDANITGAQSGIQVDPAAASTLVVSGIPSPTVAGQANNVIVEARDPFENRATGYRGTVAFTSSDDSASLPANYTFTSTDDGIRTFNGGVTLRTTGTQSVTAADTGTPSISGSQTGIVVEPASDIRLELTGYTSPRTAGSTGSLTVRVLDNFDNVVTDYTGTIRFTSTDTQATLPDDYTFLAGDNGQRTFTGVVLRTAGTHAIHAEDTEDSTIFGSLTDIVVEPAAAASLTVSGIASPITAGTSSNVVVTAYDAHGNVATGYTGTVTFTSNDTAATLPAAYTFTTDDAGSRTFVGGVTLRTAGTQSVTATDGGGLTGSQAGIDVQPAAAVSLTVTGFPSPVVAGTSASITVTARDTFNNVATGYVGTVGFSSTDGRAILPANYAFEAADGGIRTFSNVVLRTAGLQSITARDTEDTTITGTQGNIDVRPGPAAELQVTDIPSPITAGQQASVTVTARDEHGNTATGYLGTVQFTSTDGAATLPSQYSFTADDAGRRTFTSSVVLRTAGTHEVTATDVDTPAITGAQTGILVEPAAAAFLVLTDLPASMTAGVAASITVEAQDSFGNRVTNYTGTVSFASTDTAATLPFSYTFRLSDAGIRTFTDGVTLRTAGMQQVTAGDGAINGAHDPVMVEAGPATSLVVSGFPGTVTAGTTHNLTVTARDAYGNVADGYRGTVRFTSSDDQALLPADHTFTETDAGTVTLGGVSLRTAGTQSITATDVDVGTLSGTQSGITVEPAAASSLRVRDIPSPVTAGTAVDVVVEALDPFDNRDVNFTGTVSFSSTDAQASLPSSYTFGPGDAGFRRFTAGVTLRTSGLQDVTAVSGAIGGAQQDIEVRSDTAVALEVTGLPDPFTAGDASDVAVRAVDAFDNTATGYRGTIAFTSTDPGASLPSTYTFQAADEGVRTFTGAVTLITAGTRTVTATDTGTASVTGAVTTEVVADAPYQVAITGPQAGQAGTAVSLGLQVQDRYGNVAAGEHALDLNVQESATAVIASTSLGGATAGGQSASGTTAADGSATVAVEDTQVGTARLCASGLPGGETCHDIAFGSAGPDHVRLFADPDTVEAGESSTITVRIVDAFGNTVAGEVTVTLGVDGDAVFVSTGEDAVTVTTDASTGEATVSVSGTLAETVTVSVTSATSGGDALDETEPHDTVDVTFVPGPADHVIVTAPEETVAGEETALTVQVVDAYGNPTEGEATVCVTATGEDGGEPVMGPDVDPDAPGTACTTTDAGTGGGALTLTATKAEAVHLSAESTGLPGSGSDGDATVIVRPAAPDHLRLTPADEPAFACEPVDVAIQVVDAYDNPVAEAIEVQLTVSPPEAGDGSARIVETDLGGVAAADLPADTITGETDGQGRARIAVVLEAAADLEVDWSADALPGDPEAYGAVIGFGIGPADPTQSEVTAAAAQIALGTTTEIVIRPIDACGLELGAGAEVSLDGADPAGILSDVSDEGDGRYLATFTATLCPETAEITATVDGVVLDSVASVDTLCVAADPDLSTVVPVDAEVLACAVDETHTLLAVVVVDEYGNDLGPDYSVEIDEDAPFVVAVGERDWEVDPDTGLTVHYLGVGSDRCGAEPRAVYVIAGGVRLTEPAWVTFTCPPVDPGGFTFTADPDRAPADGTTPVGVTFRALDVCGNPAFGRSARIEVTADYIDAVVAPEAQLTLDEMDSLADGAASFEIRSRLAGLTGVVAIVDEVRSQPSADDLLEFTLEDVLSVDYVSGVSNGVIGQTVRLTATVTNLYGAPLTGVRLEPVHEGLVTLRAAGADIDETGALLMGGLEPGESREIHLEARIDIGGGVAQSRLLAEYSADGVAETNSARSPDVQVHVGGHPYGSGCECSTGSASPLATAPLALLLLGLALGRRRRSIGAR